MSGESLPSPADPSVPAVPTPPSPPLPPLPRVTLRQRVSAWIWGLKAYFSEQDPRFLTAFAPAFVLSVLIYVRSPLSNYIFDEQEALLANPYVNGQAGGFLHAFTRDFWGLPPDRSIGSYRPLPDLVWRALWFVSHRPFLHHWVNVLVHAVNAALVASFALSLSRRRDTSWLAGACFLATAVLTEAITGVVGIADVFGGLFVLAALVCLQRGLLTMPLCVFALVLLGLLSKESVLVALPLVPWVALVSAPIFHPRRPRRALRAATAFAASAAALVIYTHYRHQFFPVVSVVDAGAALPAEAGPLARALSKFLHWFQQPQLPHDPVNNPLVDADLPHRVAGALRVYVRGLGQLAFPWPLSGDYSYPQEPIPERVYFPESILGGLLLVLPPLAGVAIWIASLFRERRVRAELQGGAAELVAFDERQGLLALLAIGLVWLPVAYFPHSNIPVLLPTIRAERFWYLPAFGSACVLSVAFTRALRSYFPWGVSAVAVFLGFQALAGRWHAFDYTDDLIFWRATHKAVPRSAKAQLNYSVMLGARGQLEERLKVNAEAMRLAPKWPMAHVYYGDTLCRLKRAEQAWPHYMHGFELAPNDLNLIALGLQCAWEEKIIEAHKDELLAASEAHPGSWLAFLGSDIVYNGVANGGVQKKYRPRAYDEGPKGDTP
ncbi:MAG TPA: tetratricopeptide repeat protein [Polyangiaceae bacterium]|nr:tetratricopeptide repeat protein [Polyangiaceae bacterium]